MSQQQKLPSSNCQMELELYFLIAKFLENGPCKRSAKVLAEELKENKLLPKRADWEGLEHYRSYENLLQIYRHIAPDHLLRICERICPILDKEIPPNVPGVMSLLGAGRQSLLRTKESIETAKWPVSAFVALQNGTPLMPPLHMKTGPNIAITQLSREITGMTRIDHTCHSKMYQKVTMLSRSLGHLSSVYCVTFDRTGEYIITGSDDHLVKIWSSVTGRLLATLRGHSAEISDIAVSHDNCFLATGSCDKTVRVWNLKTTSPVAILHGHSGIITQIQFCPMPRGDIHYLCSTGSDSFVCFWAYNLSTKIFHAKPIKFIERSRAGAQMCCAHFSPGGVFLATGSSDSVIRVYSYGAGAFEKICELEAHTDRVDSIRYSNHSTRFLSGSKDGTARIWRFERQEWRNIVLNMSLTSPSQTSAPEENRSNKLKVTMVTWSCDDQYVITAVTDLLIKVWDSRTGKLLHCLRGHQDEVFVLEQHPFDQRIILSAGHDGNIIIWDIVSGTMLKSFNNPIQGQGHGAVFDCKWSPDGLSFASTDSHGFLRYFAFGSGENYRNCPEEQFFHTDYRPLIRDANDYVLDEQTQRAPHLMPPPFLVNIDGNPHPPKIQRLVPGRENCSEQSLVPQMGVTPSGDREVLDEPLSNADASQQQNLTVNTSDGQQDDHIIDHMISRMQHEQDQRIIAAGGEPLLSPNRSENITSPFGSPRPSTSREPLDSTFDQPSTSQDVAAGSSDGVAHPTELQRAALNVSVWSKRICVKDMDSKQLKCDEKLRQALMDEEIKQFLLERKRRPLPASGNDSSDSSAPIKTRHKGRKTARGTYSRPENEETAQNRLTTRALYDTDEEREGSSRRGARPRATVQEYEDSDIEMNYGRGRRNRGAATTTTTETASTEEDEGAVDIPSDEQWSESDTSSNSSTEYSDWAPDGGANLQPPKRRSERKVKRRKISSTGAEEDEEESEDEVNVTKPEDSESEFEGQLVRRSKRSPQSPKKKRVKINKPRKTIKRKTQQKHDAEMGDVTELKDEYRPPEWLSDSIPRKTPYFPQMGDELYYLRQGHSEYIRIVEQRKLYDVDRARWEPWQKHADLKEHELVRVVGIKFEFKKGTGVRLVCLKLNIINPETGKSTGISIFVKYHDVPDVVDFLVLRQTFEAAKRRRWKTGDRIRAAIEDRWWFGVIDSQMPFQPNFPDSLFLCYLVKWDNGEMERLSPWDFEPVNKYKNTPALCAEGIPVTKDEFLKQLYLPKDTDWSGIGIEQECDRIVRGLEQIMELSIAEPFLAPVDLQAFPLYAMIIEYPVDLSLVKRRLENRFYRRITAVQFDVRFIESNAKMFNIKGSEIVRKAKLVTELCLRLINDTNCTDIMPVYNRLVKDTDFAITDGVDSGDESGPCTPRTRRNSGRLSSRNNSMAADPYAWIFECADLLHTIETHDDSEPFRTAVNPDEYPEYYQVIDRPMDLSQIKEKIDQEHYHTPLEFIDDVRLIFSNSRAFNTNKRSRIYAMTLRLSAMFEEQIKPVVAEWKQASKKHKGKGKSSKRLPSKVTLRLNSTVMTRSLRESSSAAQEPTSLGLRSHSSRSLAGTSGLREIRGSQASTSVVTEMAKPQRRAAASRKRFFSDSFEDFAGESDKENKSDSDTDIASDVEVKPRTNTRVQRTQAQKKKNGRLSKSSSSRYGTRTQTGSAKRKHYMNTDSGDDIESPVVNHRKRARRRVSESSNEDFRSPKETAKPLRRNAKKKQNSSDETENESDSDDTEVDDESDSENSASSSEESEVTPSVQKRGNHPAGSSRGQSSVSTRQPPPLLSNRPERTPDTYSGTRGARSRSSVNNNTENNRKRLRSSSQSVSPPTEGVSSLRSNRRPARSSGVNYRQYFEEDDEEEVATATSTTTTSIAATSSTSRRSTRAKQPVTYEEDTDIEGDEGQISISSRGRIRKPNSRMRAFLGD